MRRPRPRDALLLGWLAWAWIVADFTYRHHRGKHAF